MKYLLGLSSSSLPGGNSRPGDVAPGQNRAKRKKTNSISKTTSRKKSNTLNKTTARKKSTTTKKNSPGSKKKNSGKAVTKKKVPMR